MHRQKIANQYTYVGKYVYVCFNNKSMHDSSLKFNTLNDTKIKKN